MRLQTLTAYLSERPDTTPDGDELEALSSAIGQRTVRAPEGTELADLTECTCGLLLIQIPRPIQKRRNYVIQGRVIPRVFTMYHAHVARSDGGVCCWGCFDRPSACEHDPDTELCDFPEAKQCQAPGECEDPVAPGEDTCRPHGPHGYASDRDKGTYLRGR